MAEAVTRKDSGFHVTHFDKAALRLESIAGTLDEEKLLYLYARYKQATEGPCNIPKPGIFSLRAKRKWQVWTNLGDMSFEQAKKEYVDEICKLDSSWDPNEDANDSRPKLSGLGVTVSTLKPDPNDIVHDDDKISFDWVKDGDLQRVTKFLDGGGDPNTLDDELLSLLHWACDRGHAEIASLLLRKGADVNVMDSDAQSPLHYASSCGHAETVKVLLAAGADVELPDEDGNTPKDVAMDENIASLFL